MKEKLNEELPIIRDEFIGQRNTADTRKLIAERVIACVNKLGIKMDVKIVDKTSQEDIDNNKISLFLTTSVDNIATKAT